MQNMNTTQHCYSSIIIFNWTKTV